MTAAHAVCPRIADGIATVASTTTVIPAKGEAGVSDRWRSARATALACKPVRALQGGIQRLSLRIR